MISIAKSDDAINYEQFDGSHNENAIEMEFEMDGGLFEFCIFQAAVYSTAVYHA